MRESEEGLRCADLGVLRRGAGGREHWVLDGVDAHFDPGQIALLTGPTGAGKSTLLHVLAALLRPSRGEVLAAGEPISRWLAAHRDRWRRGAGITLQQPALWPELSALENVLVPLVPRPLRLSESRELAAAALTALGDAELAPRPVAELSLGQKQRVALARALVAAPAYVLVDEPTAHQDDDSCELVRRRLADEAARGAVVVVASHDRRLTKTDWADRHWVLREGRLAPPESGGGD